MNLKKTWKKYLLGLLALLMVFTVACTGTDLDLDAKDTGLKEGEPAKLEEELPSSGEEEGLDEEGYYFTEEDVALYIDSYDRLPANYITKSEAKKLGWNAKEGNLWEVTDRMIIGGDYFGNREGNLPEKEGRKYFECDVNYSGGFRGKERLVYSNDGLIYYTDDHYNTFKLLYGDE